MANRSSDAAGTGDPGLGAGDWGLARATVGAGGSGLAASPPTRNSQSAWRSHRKKYSAILAISAAFAFSTSVSAQPPDRARTEALARRATERLQSLQRDADRLAAEERSLLNDLK